MMSDYAHPQQIETPNLYYNDPSCSTAMENCSDKNYLERNGYNKTPTERSENYDPKLSCIIDNPCYHDRSKSVALDQAPTSYWDTWCSTAEDRTTYKDVCEFLTSKRQNYSSQSTQSPATNPCTDNYTKDQILEAYMTGTKPKECSKIFMENNFGESFQRMGTSCGLAG